MMINLGTIFVEMFIIENIKNDNYETEFFISSSIVEDY